MKTMLRLMTLIAALMVPQLCTAQAPAGAPAGATALCNDGTYFSGATKQGGCRGHKGIKTWFGAAATAAAPAKAPKAQPAAPAAASAATPPAGATALCNDGTYFSGATKQGGCRGHQGIKTWFGATTAAAPVKAPAAQPAAPMAAQSGTPPAGATALCNDGTYFTGATKQGGCRGHKGIKTWFGATATAPVTTAAAKAAPPAAAPMPAPAPAPRATSSTIAPAAGGGAGQVWLNTASNIYHCQGSQWYGKTKAGAYMSEDQAKAKGARPDHGKPCK